MERRRRTDQLPLPAALPSDPRERGRAACAHVVAAGFDAALAIHVPRDGSQGVLCGATGRAQQLLDVARGLSRATVADGAALRMLDVDGPSRRARHAAIPVGRTESGTVVLVASDPRLARREAQALAAWAAPAAAGEASDDPCAPLARELAAEMEADVVAIALFAQSGMLLNLHVRSGALLHGHRIPTDTVWGEVARHGAAFTLGDLSLHPGTEVLGSLGMQSAGLVGLDNGCGLPIGALGVAGAGELHVDVAHQLLARAASLGPALMSALSSTPVPVPDASGTVDLRALAARVGCRRFAMYQCDGEGVRLVAAHAQDGSRLMSPADEQERRLVHRAVEQGVGVHGEQAAAVRIGDHTVLYAQDPARRALECLRLALQDVRRNPFGGEEQPGERQDADAA